MSWREGGEGGVMKDVIEKVGLNEQALEKEPSRATPQRQSCSEQGHKNNSRRDDKRTNARH